MAAVSTKPDVAVDQELVRLAQAGDMRAFEMLVNKYQYRVTRLVARYVKDADAPDVAQETFIKAWRALSGFRGESAFYTWLYRIAVNAAKNHLEQLGRKITGRDAIEIADAEDFGHMDDISHSDTPERLLMSEQLQQLVQQTINALPVELRGAITLRELEGLGYEEIAEVMECPIGTVRSRIFRAREILDKVIKPYRD